MKLLQCIMENFVMKSVIKIIFSIEIIVIVTIFSSSNNICTIKRIFMLYS